MGLIGPNGAGKTTVIRMLMGIMAPDQGEIHVLGEPLCEETKNRIGYLPEERGLYRKLTVLDALSYLASLKNIPPEASKKRASELLERTGMAPHQDKKISELSKGMAQLIQFIVTILHNPELVVLDEPFYGLDPVNTRMIKDVVAELGREGKSVILSTHMMNEVEELCDRVLMINEGRTVLYGSLDEVKSPYRTNSVLLEADGELTDIPGVIRRQNHGKYYELFLDGTTSPQSVLTEIMKMNVPINRFEVASPPLSEIFIQVAKGQRNE